MNPPNSKVNLDKALLRIAEGDRDAYLRIRAVVANTVVGQLLPSGAVKGGSAIKLRLGDSSTRFTTDLDVARAETVESFAESLGTAVAEPCNSERGLARHIRRAGQGPSRSRVARRRRYLGERPYRENRRQRISRVTELTLFSGRPVPVIVWRHRTSALIYL